MFRTFAIGTLAALTLTTAGLAANTSSVKTIKVEVELEAIANPKAAAYWTSIADDLENAIVARITDQIADDGIALKIDLQEVSLSGGFAEMLGIADTRLVGDVIMTHETDNSRFGAYKLTVDVNAVTPILPPDTDVTTMPADSRVYYDAMVATFADAVVERLK
jgi:hypothetical protein